MLDIGYKAWSHFTLKMVILLKEEGEQSVCFKMHLFWFAECCACNLNRFICNSWKRGKRSNSLRLCSIDRVPNSIPSTRNVKMALSHSYPINTKWDKVAYGKLKNLHTCIVTLSTGHLFMNRKILTISPHIMKQGAHSGHHSYQLLFFAYTLLRRGSVH